MADVDGLHASTEDINAHGSSTITNAGYFEKEIGVLGNNVESLRAIWKGPASDAFYGVYEDMKNELTDFKEVLEELGQNVQKAASIINEGEEENTARGRNLFNRFG